MRFSTTGIDSAPKAGRPVAANTIVTPHANTSEAGLAVASLSSSGAR